MESDVTPFKKLLKRIPAMSNGGQLSSSWKTIRNAFIEFLKDDSLDSLDTSESKKYSKDITELPEDLLSGKSEDAEDKARNAFVVVYCRCLSQAFLHLDLFYSLNEFLISYPVLLISELEFFAEALMNQLQVEMKTPLKIAWCDRLKLRFYIVQTLITIAHYQGTEMNAEQMTNVHEVLLNELQYLVNNPSVEWLSDRFEFGEAQWVQREDKCWVMIADVKCFSYILPKNSEVDGTVSKRVYSRYVFLYYIWRLIKIKVTKDLLGVYENEQRVLYIMLMKNRLHLLNVDLGKPLSKEREETVFEVLNEYLVMFKCFTKLLNSHPEAIDCFKAHFQIEFKYIVAEHLSIVEKLEVLEAKSVGRVLKTFNSFLLTVSRKFASEQEFIVDKEVYGFYERCDRTFTKPKLQKISRAVIGYFCYRSIEAGAVVRVLSTRDSAVGEAEGGMNGVEKLRMFLDFISHILQDEIGFQEISIKILDALTQLLVKVNDEERREMVEEFILQLVQRKAELLKNVQWNEEGIFIHQLIRFLKRICEKHTEACCKILSTISNSVKHPNEAIQKNHQRVICFDIEWTVLLDYVQTSRSYSLALELLELLKNLIDSNRVARQKIENDLNIEDKQLARPIVKAILSVNSPDIELISRIKNTLLEISFEVPYYPNRPAKIKNLLFFEEYVMILCKVLKNKDYLQLAFDYLIEILEISTCHYENRVLISSVNLASSGRQKVSARF